MAKSTDDWPKRIGIPTLNDSLRLLDFVHRCLQIDDNTEPQQAEARRALAKARAEVNRAINLLQKG